MKRDLASKKSPAADPKARNGTILAQVRDQPARAWPVGTRIEEVLEADTSPEGLAYMGALVNNDDVSLSFALEVNCTVTPITLQDHTGYRIYRRSLSFLLAKVVREHFPKVLFRIEHSIGTGFYCTFERDAEGITPSEIQRIEKGLRTLVERNVPIARSKLSYGDALEQFEAEAQQDKHNLLRFRNPPFILVYSCEDFSDLAHGVMAARTGMLPYFALHAYHTGFVIQFPGRDDPRRLPDFADQPELFEIFKEHKRWGRILGLSTVGQLNEKIATGDVGRFIHIAEALHEKKIAEIADRISSHSDEVHFVLIAGPSSAGKTTLSKRLMVQLRVNGVQPATISVDDYFLNREDTPRDENGELDFEHLEAIDLPFLNEHLREIALGREVTLPRFNFQSGRREFNGGTLRLQEGQILILEGIHCLNPRLTEALPAKCKYKLYTSALGQLNLDRHNRISTTDLRLLRRMVRDHKFRGHTALRTLQMWPSVRRGEKRWIFPTQKHADIMFNSALEYEMAVLKPLAEPLLVDVKPDAEEYANARRLLEFLGYFLAAENELVPASSILREYIGKSCFEY